MVILTFKKAIIEMNKVDLKGLVLDLRYNGGGLLLQATTILDFLLKELDYCSEKQH